MLLQLATALLAGQAVAAGPVVFNEKNKVWYEGISSNGIDQFLGLRYAKDTSGENRFVTPIPYHIPPRSKVKATKRGDACPQARKGIVPPMSDVEEQSEDCLNLRLARPANSKLYTKPLPVMVYFYGGGSILGDAYDGFFNPVGLVQQSIKNKEPVIYVAANYRVGIFGFPAAQILKDAHAENLGLRDQVAALQWVRANVAAFGGDPDNVTLFGQSFGGISVGLQMVAWGGNQEKLFHKAIITSGAISANRNDAIAKHNTYEVTKKVDCAPHNGVVDYGSIECLQNVFLEDLLEANQEVATSFSPPYGFSAFPPVIDGDVIPDQPEKLLTEGNFLKDIPTLVTWAADDGSLATDSKTRNDSDVLAQISSLIPHFTPEIGEKILSLYPVSDFEARAKAYPSKTPLSPQYFRASRIIRDIDPVCPLLTLITELHAHGSKDIYVGELNETRLQPYWDAWKQPWGVSHLSDVPYFFNENLPKPGDNSPRAKELSAKYSGSFISFANSGNPAGGKGAKTLGAWPKVEDGALIIGGKYGTGPAATKLLLKAAAKAWTKTELRRRAEVSGSDEEAAMAGDEATAALESERLIERCEYLKTLRAF